MTIGTQIAIIRATIRGRAVKVWTGDESRVGMRTIRALVLTDEGYKPIRAEQCDYQAWWVHGAVAPETGDHYFLILPHLDTACVQTFLNDFAQQDPETMHILIWDNSRTHTTKHLVIPENVRILFQPPYAPEVNPTERVWQALKRSLAWERYSNREDFLNKLCKHISDFTNDAIQHLTQYPWLMKGIIAACQS